MKIHELKTLTIHYDDIASGVKTFELRKNDRGFSVGDVLDLRRYQAPDGDGCYTGERMRVMVTHMTRGPLYGLDEGYVCMSIESMEHDDADLGLYRRWLYNLDAGDAHAQTDEEDNAPEPYAPFETITTGEHTFTLQQDPEIKSWMWRHNGNMGLAGSRITAAFYAGWWIGRRELAARIRPLLPPDSDAEPGPKAP